MRVKPRSHVTSIPPRMGSVAETFKGFPYFTSRPDKITFHPANDGIVYLYRNPVVELARHVKETARAQADIDFNFAIAQNTDEIYTLRGFVNKPHNSEHYKVLVLISEDEAPTDQLKRNVASCRSLVDPSIEIQSVMELPQVILSPDEHSVHVFNLIEYLALNGFYEGKNDGFYGAVCRQAVMKYQDSRSLPLTGVWDEHCIAAIVKREQILFNA